MIWRLKVTTRSAEFNSAPIKVLKLFNHIFTYSQAILAVLDSWHMSIAFLDSSRLSQGPSKSRFFFQRLGKTGLMNIKYLICAMFDCAITGKVKI